MKRTELKRKTAIKAKRSTPRRRGVGCDIRGCVKRPTVTVWDGTRLCDSHATDRADRVVRAFVMLRDEVCQSCFTPIDLQWSHHITRSIHAVRWDEENSCVHCAGCHRFFTSNPALHAEWIEQHLGKRVWAEVKDRAYGPIDPYTGTRTGPVRVDKADIIRRYEEAVA